VSSRSDQLQQQVGLPTAFPTVVISALPTAVVTALPPGTVLEPPVGTFIPDLEMCDEAATYLK
jgi:hypothetical protein